MPLKLYNTLARKKEEFKPLHGNKVGMYACGITAYDSCHLGHARAAVNFDVIVRYLRFKGFAVTYVRNFTDIDDKIINRAIKEKRSCTEISEHYIEEYRTDMCKLGNKDPDIEPKATEHIKDMIKTILNLIKNGMAYEKNGDVFFSVRKFNGYGKLSGKKIDELEIGARININEAKEDPLDFALWKASKPGEPEWESPWGKGRPGWHIECSAMSSKYLGQPFDIHGGGRDLVFPHHENEIAQAEGAEKKEFVRYWLHNGFININAEKMSKSLGNFLTVRQILEVHPAEAVRYFIISNHYRSPIDYTERAIQEAVSTLDRYYETVLRINFDHSSVIPAKAGVPRSSRGMTAPEKTIWKSLEVAEKRVLEMMDDDFNTAGAFGAIFELVRATNRYLDSNPEKEIFYTKFVDRWKQLKNDWDNMFGVFGTEASQYFEAKKKLSGVSSNIDEKRILSLINERIEARKNKDFARADEIRNELDRAGIILKDKPDGTTEWKLK